MKKDFWKHMMVLTETNDLRDTIRLISDWSDNMDFTYYDSVLENPKYFFRAFVISRFYDLQYPAFYLYQV